MQSGYPELDVISNVPTIKMSGTNITANTTHIFMDKVKVDRITGNGFHLTNLPIQSSDVSITSVDISDAEWNILGYTAVDTSGGYIVLTGEGFGPGSMVQVDTTNAIRVSYVSSTQSRVRVPPKPSGSYDLTMIRGDGETDTLLSGLTYSSRAGILLPNDEVQQGKFGSSVAMSTDGTRIVVGAVGAHTTVEDSGAAYVFSYTGVWTQQKLAPSAPENNALFGSSVAMSENGTRIVIGSPDYDVTSGGTTYTDSGAAYIFEYNTETQLYEQQTMLFPGTPQERSIFGEYFCGMSNDGTQVIIGAREYDGNQGTDSGAAYIFSYNGTSWIEQQLQPTNPLQPGDRFGWSCTMSGDGERVVVGASTRDTSLPFQAGAAYIFKKSGTSWVEEQLITANDAEREDFFGDSCAISYNGEYLVIGATYEGATDSGAVYVFTRNGTTWTQEQKLGGLVSSSNLGYSCAMSADGQRIVVGTNVGSSDQQGLLYIYSRDGTQPVGSRWTIDKTLTAGDKGGKFGYSCAISADGEIVVAGAPLDDPLTPSDHGTAYIIVRTPTGDWEF